VTSNRITRRSVGRVMLVQSFSSVRQRGGSYILTVCGVWEQFRWVGLSFSMNSDYSTLGIGDCASCIQRLLPWRHSTGNGFPELFPVCPTAITNLDSLRQYASYKSRRLHGNPSEKSLTVCNRQGVFCLEFKPRTVGIR